LRDFVISLAPSLKTEQHASHLNSWSQIRGPLHSIRSIILRSPQIYEWFCSRRRLSS
jgi:hypothetical protein